MAATGTPTPNIGLRIPLGTDPASVDDINYNSNLIDTKLGAVGNDSVQDQLDDLNSKISQTGASPKAGEALFQLNGLKFFRARSAEDAGWVYDFIGEDASGNTVRVGFDKTNGIYCSLNNTQMWLFGAVKEKTITGTTNAYGAISTGLQWRTNDIVSVVSSSSSQYCLVTPIGSTVWVRVMNDASTFSPVTNTSVTLTVKYREY